MTVIGRLKRRADFVRLTRQGRRQVMPGFILQVSGITDGDGADLRVGFTVSKRVGNAVERNRVRRRLRAVVGEVFPACAAPGRDYVIVGRRAGLERPYPSLLTDLKSALRKAGSCRQTEAPATETSG